MRRAVDLIAAVARNEGWTVDVSEAGVLKLQEVLVPLVRFTLAPEDALTAIWVEGTARRVILVDDEAAPADAETLLRGLLAAMLWKLYLATRPGIEIRDRTELFEACATATTYEDVRAACGAALVLRLAAVPTFHDDDPDPTSQELVGALERHAALGSRVATLRTFLPILERRIAAIPRAAFKSSLVSAARAQELGTDPAAFLLAAPAELCELRRLVGDDVTAALNVLHYGTATVDHPTGSVVVRVPDQPGELGSASTTLGSAGINIVAVDIRPAAMKQSRIEVEVARRDLKRAVAELTQAGFDVLNNPFEVDPPTDPEVTADRDGDAAPPVS